MPRLDVLKALGDNTRYAIYLELVRSPQPRTTAEIAETLALHPNTVRPHLERMRDVGLLHIDVETRGEVGRPQHRYSLAADAPSLGLEPPSTTLLSNMLLRLVEVAGIRGSEAAEIGRAQGAADADRYQNAPSSLEALVSQHDRVGFDPIVADGVDDDTAVMAFAHCPFRSFAEANPDVVCSLHRGLVEGFLDRLGDTHVEEFCSLVHRTPCQVTVTSR